MPGANISARGSGEGAHCSGICVMSAVCSADAFSWMAAGHERQRFGQRVRHVQRKGGVIPRTGNERVGGRHEDEAALGHRVDTV